MRNNEINIIEFIEQAVKSEASDIFLIAGMPYSCKINGKILYKGDTKVLPNELDIAIEKIYELAGNRSMNKVRETGDDDFSFSIKGLSRFRVSVMRQRGSLAAIIRIVRFELPNYKKLNIPEQVMRISQIKSGLALITGPAGSGKSTTLACLVDEINKNRNAHVITLEDPIEYLHRHNKGVITQREIGTDTVDYLSGLRAALRQAPDVILLGEMRDYETIKTAMTAAETGHLVISTLHTLGAVNSIDRIIDSFPPEQQNQIRIQLPMVLRAVVTQELIERADGRGVVPAWEIMFIDSAIKNMIREGNTQQINGYIKSSSESGMMTMDDNLIKLYKNKIISKEMTIMHSFDNDVMAKKIERLC